MNHDLRGDGGWVSASDIGAFVFDRAAWVREQLNGPTPEQLEARERGKAWHEARRLKLLSRDPE